MNRMEILQSAIEKVSGERNLKYGLPEYSFDMIAKFWTTYMGVTFSASDVAAMMAS